MADKICVVGGGRWGKNHIRTLDSLGLLGGIVEAHDARRKELGASYPQAKTFASIREAIEEPFDGFTVATPAETHFTIAEFLLNHKKPVLVEKPLSLKSSEARALNALAEKNGVTLMVGHVLLFHPAIREMKRQIVAGKIGKLEYIYSNRLNLGTVRKEENILWSFAPHDISIFQYFIEDQPTEVLSRGGVFIQPGIHDSTMTILTYPGNIVGHIFVSWLHPFKEHRLVIIGSKGMLSFDDSSDSKEIRFYEKGIDWIEGEPIKRDGPTESLPYERKMPLTEELTYFANNLRAGSVDVANGQNGVEVLEILERASASLVGDHQKAPAPVPAEKPKFFVHPSSYVDDGCEIGEGTSIWHFTHIQKNVKIGKKCSFGQNVNVGNDVVIGDYVKVQNNVSVYEGVELEDYAFCGPSMVFTNVLEPRSKYPVKGKVGGFKKTLVREGATLGANSTVVCGNTVGRHSLIGAGAVVTKDVPDYALMVGTPARRIGWRCECGSTLPEDFGPATCGRCGLGYEISERGVESKS